MKNIYITIIFFLFCSSIHLQEKLSKDAYITTWGDVKWLSGNIVEVLHEERLNFLAIRGLPPRITSRTRYFFEKYNHLNHVKSEEVFIEKNRRINTVLALGKLSNKALALTRSESNDNSMSLFLNFFSTESLSLSEESIHLDKFETNVDLKPFKGWISTNDKNNSFAVFYEFPTPNKDFSGIAFNLFNSDFELVKADHLIFDQPKNQFYVSDIKFTNNDNFFIVTHHHDLNKEVINPGPTTIFMFDGEELIEYNLNLRNYNLRDSRVQVKKNHFVLSGLLSRQNSKNRVGAYAIRIDSRTGRVMSETVFEFDEEKLTKVRGSFNAEDNYFFTRMDKDKVEYSLEDLRLNNLFISDDNEIIGVIEQQNDIIHFRKRLIQPKHSTKYREKPFFNNNNLLIYKIGSDGILKWESVIEKRQRSKEDELEYLSIVSKLKGEYLYILHNDDKRNYDEDGMHKNKNQIWSANSMDFRRCLGVCKVDIKTGKFIRYKIKSEHNSRFPLNPNVSSSSGSEKGIIINNKKGNRNQFGEIVFVSE